MEFVSWDDDIPKIWKNKNHVPNHQPVMNNYHGQLLAYLMGEWDDYSQLCIGSFPPFPTFSTSRLTGMENQKDVKSSISITQLRIQSMHDIPSGD